MIVQEQQTLLQNGAGGVGVLLLHYYSDCN